MLEHPDCPRDEKTGSQAEWIDDVADRFDGAWRDGSAPRIGDFLGQASAEARLPLLKELVQIDFEYRCRAGEKPVVDDYIHAFPELETDRVVGDELRDYAQRAYERFATGDPYATQIPSEAANTKA